jgi:hypothetical protein
VAKILVFTPDLLFGSSVLGALTAGGHSAVLCSNTEALRVEAAGAELVVIDLTDEAAERAAQLAELRADGVLAEAKTLGYHSHVDPDSREVALEYGVEKVVPRSRMHREPTVLVAQLLESA